MHQDRLFHQEDLVPDLASYDLILISTSGGKDSQAMTDLVVELAGEAKVPRERLVMAHADLSEMEWPGTREVVEAHARAFGLRLEVVRRPGADLLGRVEERGMWPDAARRWCTSAFKRTELLKLTTRLVSEVNARRLLGRHKPPKKTGMRPVRVLSCMGMRAQESRARSKKSPLARDERGSSSNRTIDNWLPLFAWSEDEVWERVRVTGLPVHPAYALGMSRASCSLCVLSSKKDLVTAARMRPDLAGRYADVEAKTGHSFRKDLSMREITELARREE